MIGGAVLWTREIKTAFQNAATSTVAKVWIFLEIQNHNNFYNQSICYSDKLKKINVFYVRCFIKVTKKVADICRCSSIDKCSKKAFFKRHQRDDERKKDSKFVRLLMTHVSVHWGIIILKRIVLIFFREKSS
jgi:hypothetical protein